MFLVNVVFFSKEGNKGWKMSVLEHLFGSVVRESKYVKEGDMKAVVCNANEGLEYVTQYSVVKTEEHKEVLEGVFGEGLIGKCLGALREVCTRCGVFETVDFVYPQNFVAVLVPLEEAAQDLPSPSLRPNSPPHRNPNSLCLCPLSSLPAPLSNPSTST